MRCVRSAPLAVLGAASLAALLASTPARAQGFDTFGPQELETSIGAPSFYDQYWPRIAQHGSTYAAAWSIGQDIWACYYDADLQPIGGAFQVNTTLTYGNQDEPDLAFDANGRLLIAWSDREGNDGQLMGIFGRAYDQNRVALGPEFQVNEQGAQSQWRPLVTPNRFGGWIVAFSGNWDGDAFIRIFDGNAHPRSGDIRANEWLWDAQVDPDVAVAPNGNLFVVFVDYSSHGTVGSGLNLYGRVYDATGNPLQTEEFPLTSWTSNGDQMNPRVVCDGLGRFVVTWDDQLSDGNGWGVFARRFDASGNALGPEFQVNQLASGDQTGSVPGVDASGRLSVMWKVGPLGSVELRARRFDANGQPLGGDFAVNGKVAGDQLRPDLVVDPAGGEVLFVYDGPVSGPGTPLELWARRFLRTDGPQTYCTAKLNSQGCLAATGFSGTPSASSGAPFLVQAANVVNRKTGLLLYSFSSAFVPFQGGTLCVGSSFRAGAQNSGGSASGSDCSGGFAFDFNALIRSGANPLLVPGATVQTQWIHRDFPIGGSSIGLSDAGRFAIQN